MRTAASNAFGALSAIGRLCCEAGNFIISLIPCAPSGRPFGEITDVNFPLDAGTQKHKGFAFVQYDEKEDAAEAIDNMHNSELFGRVLRVNLAKPDVMKGSHRPVWEVNADNYFKEAEADEAAGE